MYIQGAKTTEIKGENTLNKKSTCAQDYCAYSISKYISTELYEHYLDHKG